MPGAALKLLPLPKNGITLSIIKELTRSVIYSIVPALLDPKLYRSGGTLRWLVENSVSLALLVWLFC